MSASIQHSRAEYLLGGESVAGHLIAKPATRPRAGARARQRPARQTVIGFAVFGLASALLYGLFFLAIKPLFRIYTSQDVLGVAAVIGTALTFSLVYGTFAKYLLAMLGLKALK